jgi:hypothetical protein
MLGSLTRAVQALTVALANCKIPSGGGAIQEALVPVEGDAAGDSRPDEIAARESADA